MNCKTNFNVTLVLVYLIKAYRILHYRGLLILHPGICCNIHLKFVNSHIIMSLMCMV